MLGSGLLLVLPLLLGFAAPATAALDVVAIRAPKTARLTNRRPVARVHVVVTVRNTGDDPVTLADADAVAAAVGLTAKPGDGDVVCPTPTPALLSRRLPLTIRAGRRRSLRWDVAVPCASRVGKTLGRLALGVGSTDGAFLLSVRDRRDGARFRVAGTAAVGTTTLALVDATRATQPNGTWPGAPDRTIPTWVWYPAATAGADVPLAGGGPYPLVVFSHGLGSYPAQSEFLVRHLASHGWIVAAPQYPLGHIGAPGGRTLADKRDEAGDVSFVIDTLLAGTAPGTERFAGAVDADRIALTGHSAGGLLTLVTTYDATVRDPRVKAAAPLAPAGCFLDAGYFGAVSVPLLLLHGDRDLLVGLDGHGRRPWSFANPPKRLGVIAGGNHMGFADAGLAIDDAGGCQTLPPFAENAAAALRMIESLGGTAAHLGLTGCPVEMCVGDPAHLDGRRQAQIAKEAVLAFFEAEVRGDAAARAFLDEELPATTPELTLESVP